MYQTTYHRPKTLADAVALFSKGSDATYLAGGHTLIPVMKQRLAAPSDVIDIARIPELVGIEAASDALTIKAATTYIDIINSDEAKRSIPAIVHLTEVLGDPAVRHRGTIGGSIANNDPAADYPAAVLALGGMIVTDRREIKGEEFFTGLMSTALQPGEIITAIRFPIPQKAGYEKFRHPASRFALTGVFVARTQSGEVRVAVTGAYADGVQRVPAIEQALSVNWSPSALDSVAIAPDGIIADIHGSAMYRANLIKVMAQRAVAQAG
jgi:carbon-monoxide dehydrogenase medium subunit